MLSANDSDKRFEVANARAPMLSEVLKDAKQEVQGLVLGATDKFAGASLIIGQRAACLFVLNGNVNTLKPVESVIWPECVLMGRLKCF